MSKEVEERYNKSVIDTQVRAAVMKAALVAPQFSGNQVYISDPAQRDAAIGDAAMQTPLYSSMGEEPGRRQALSDASAIREYTASHNALPGDDLFAAAHGALENLFSNNQALADSAGTGMLLSSMSESNLSSEKGVTIRATTAALTLPTLLSNPMNAIVSYLPVRKYETEIFNIERIAGKTLGDFKKNQIIDELSFGQYSNQRQRYIFADAQLPDGTKKAFTFSAQANTPAQIAMPVRAGSVKVYINRDCKEPIKQIDGGDLYGVVTFADVKIVISGTVDVDTCAIAIETDKALPTGVTLHAEFEIDIESNSDLIPTVNHRMTSHKFRPASRVIGADASIMAMFAMNTEFGVDINSTNLSSMRTWLANERALKQLDDLMFFVQEVREFDAQVPTEGNETWQTRFEYIKSLFLEISQHFINTNKESGLKGLYCGTLFSTFIKMLPSSLFQLTPGYTQTTQIHFVGTLLGNIKIFEVPFTNLVPADKALAYSRTDKLGKAPYFTGDVIPPTLYSHDVDKSLNKANTLWAHGYDNAAPDCDKFLCLITLKNFVAG